MIAELVLVAGLSPVVVATADDPIAPRSLAVATAVFAAAATADWVTTYRSQRVDGIDEGDPLLAWAGDPAKVVAVGVALDVATTWAITRFVGKKHPKLVTAGLYVAAVARTWMAWHNEQLRRRAQRGGPK